MDSDVRAMFLYAVDLHRQGKVAAAAASYRELLRHAPHLSQSHHNLGFALGDLGELDEAEQCLRTALQLRPDYATAYNTLGGLLRRQQRFTEAIACFERAIALRPNYSDAVVNLANTLIDVGKDEAARNVLQHAAVAAPDSYRVHWSLGRLFTSLKLPTDALASLTRAAELAPDSADVKSALLIQRQIVCEWTGIDTLEQAVLAAIDAGDSSIEPLVAADIASTPAQQLACARAKARELSAIPAIGIKHSPRKHDRVRIGYLSDDLRHHATAFLMAEVFELHDRSRFETVALSYGWDDGTATRRRIERSFDIFIDLARETDDAIARRIAAEEIDILVDLNAYSGGGRPGIVARRPAPLQVNFLGYPGTMGADFMDYIVADAHVIPPEHEYFYTEKLVLLPHSYQPNDRQRTIAANKPRSEHGLPDRGFVFCCFNASYKLRPGFFAIWMRLLRDTPGAVLWLMGPDPLTIANLRRTAQAHGVDPARLIFALHVSLEEHLARYRHADLFLDTLPYNAHTTMSDALWAGLPAVTCTGASFAGRVGGSLLKAVGLPELIADTPDAYERLIRDLVGNPDRLAQLRATLAADRACAPLFDTPRYTQALESAYTEMWDLYRAGESPRRIVVTSESSP